MFNKDELNFLMNCVDSSSISTTKEARNKSFMMMKLAGLIDAAISHEKSEVTEDSEENTEE
jgi:hypothetical protein